MPNIRGFDAPSNLGLNPSETGVESVAGTARRVGAFYNQLGGATQELGAKTAQLGATKAAMWDSLGKDASSDIRTVGDVVVKYEDHQQVSHGAATGTQLASSLDDDWNAFSSGKDPNDPSIRQQFMETHVEPALDKFKEGFTTENSQAWAEHFADTLRTHLSQKSAADMSARAGIAAKGNATGTINNLSNMARNDPSSVPAALDMLDHSVNGIAGSSPALDATTAAKVASDLKIDGRAAIIKSGALGLAQKAADPEKAVRDFASRYPDDLAAPEIDQLAKAAQYYKRLNVSEDRADQANAQRAAKDDFNKKLNALEASTMPTTAGARAQLPPDYWDKLREYSTHPGAALEPTRLKSMVEAGEHLTERLNKPEPLGPVSHNTTIDLLGRIRATDPSRLQSNDEIYKAYGEGRLNTTDFNFLQKEYQDMRTPEGQALNADRSSFFKNYGTAIAGSSYSPATGDPKIYNAEMDARRVENDLKKKGLDPHLAYDPSSQYFLGKPDRIQKWQSSMQQDLQARASGGLPAAKDITGIETVPAPVGTSVPRPAAPPPPVKGMVKDGYEFLGGSPGAASSWRKVEEKT